MIPINPNLPIVLPTHALITQYMTHVSVCSNTEYNLDELLGCVCGALEYSRQTELVRHVDNIYDKLEHYIGATDASIISKATLDLGLALHHIYTDFGLYDHTGRCNHYYRRLLGRDILLEVYPPEYVSPNRGSHASVTHDTRNPGVSQNDSVLQRPRCTL